MSDRRGRRSSRYDDGDTTTDYYQPRPRYRSLGRQALDKLEDTMNSLGLGDGRSHHSAQQDRAVERYYPPPPPHHHHHHHHRGRRRYHSSSPTRASRRSHRSTAASPRDSSSRSRGRWERGIEAAAEAAAVEAFRLRHEPGRWRGPKGERVATEAISAGVIGAATEQRGQDHGGGKLGTLGSALGGLVVNRLVNGPRDEVRR
ncbi:uncharacterized protein THITE_125031 [Thermothielavioides terrestris NRRL 8126]|uniref:Uncharacterized protein n=1 Tax=Thermothielavioides terrestris (strain ATCC 38088 / NRRL 8126) TaxID=578455 RepID=G2R5M0_THETT|nr:uncharacterized protein THITE_125031 [Thermothielavioides terrestris NRRL 8126]AEO68312.1 hypothetical protein THITE_125031 [Thermothielavioides terrestris NRRL 8126]